MSKDTKDTPKDYTRTPELRQSLMGMLQELGSHSNDVLWQFGSQEFTSKQLQAELHDGTVAGCIFTDQLFLAARTLLARAKGRDPDEPEGGLTLCACKHASGHHDFQQNGRCLKHRCGCLAFDPKESVDPESENEEEVRMERDSLVAMYNRSQEGTTHDRRMMSKALGIDPEKAGSHSAMLISVCSELMELREKEKSHV